MFDGPDYLTIHALEAEEEGQVPPDDAWYPLEWPNVRRELDRADAIMSDEAVTAAAAALGGQPAGGSWPWMKEDPNGVGDFDDLFEPQPEALVEAALNVRRRLEQSSISVADHFALAVCHFEGWGASDSLPRANPETVWSNSAGAG